MLRGEPGAVANPAANGLRFVFPHQFAARQAENHGGHMPVRADSLTPANSAYVTTSML